MSVAEADELTLADMLKRLGGISAERVRFRPAPGTATENDVVQIHNREQRLFELVDGVLVEKAMGWWESVLTIELGRVLGNFVDRRKLGVLAGPDGMLRLFPGLVRIPDLSFVSNARIAGHRAKRESVLPLAPDLAIEVLSEGNTPREIDRKIREYFQAGTRLAWVFYPVERDVTVYTSADHFTVLSEKQTLTGGRVLPGFKLPLRKLFAKVEG